MATKIPSHSEVSDSQVIQVSGPDGRSISYQYDKEQRTFYASESSVISSAHGSTHISTDPIPEATCDMPGLMSADDKCKLDALLQTRIGVLGFMGAGFPDDGGWLTGDIILASGTDFITIERIGNIVRFVVDAPIPLNCSCESCTQIYWVQDETDVSAIRPPSCGGKVPGVNGYGELKFYLLPENTIVNPAKPSDALNLKGRYPSLVFKRFNSSTTTGTAEFHLTLARSTSNQLQTTLGWSMTPGTSNIAECQWFMGYDNDNNLMKFAFKPNLEPGMLGSLLYKGHSITKAMGVITEYTQNILTSNQYNLKWWDVVNQEVVGTQFTATNIWQYTNAGLSTQELVLDASRDLLAIGTLVDVWFFEIGGTGSSTIYRYYINEAPPSSSASAWSQIGAISFGDELTAKEESEPTSGETDIRASTSLSNFRDWEQAIWGITNYNTPLYVETDLEDGVSVSEIRNGQHKARIDTDLPGLIIDRTAIADATGNFSERPAYIWNRIQSKNSLVTMKIGRPEIITTSPTGVFPPYDILIGAPIDSYDTLFLKVKASGAVSGSSLYYARVTGVQYKDIPEFGTLRILNNSGTGTAASNSVWNYQYKALDNGTDFSVTLISSTPYPGADNDIVELAHQDYDAPCVRLQFAQDGDEIQLQFKVGTLSMSDTYEGNSINDLDDYVRGMADGYAVSSIYTQAESWSGLGSKPAVSVDDFVVYDGGSVGSTEYWNELEIMFRSGQVWIWWNGLLVPPDSVESADLDSPVTISTPYFPVSTPLEFGKFGMRLWPGAKVRSIIARAQNRDYSEYTRGQLVVS